MSHEKRKQFYLIRRKDKLTKGKPTFYCRFRGADGDLLPWQSTAETARGRAENWAIANLAEQKVEPSPALTLEEFAEGFFRWGSPWTKRQAKKGRAFGRAQAKNRQNHHDRYILPRFGQTTLAEISKPSVEDWLSGLPLANSTLNQIMYALRIVFREARERKLINENPLQEPEPFGTDEQAARRVHRRCAPGAFPAGQAGRDVVHAGKGCSNPATGRTASDLV